MNKNILAYLFNNFFNILQDYNLLCYKWWWIIMYSTKLFIKTRKMLWWQLSFHLYSSFPFFKERYYHYLTEYVVFSWKEYDKLFFFWVNFQLYSILLLLEYLFCLLQIAPTMGLFFQRKLCLKIDQALWHQQINIFQFRTIKISCIPRVCKNFLSL